MKENADLPVASTEPALTTEVLVLPDGRILAHNLTPAFADLLSGLDPANEQIRARARASRSARGASPLTPPAP
jgi:hypothetical protein